MLASRRAEDRVTFKVLIAIPDSGLLHEMVRRIREDVAKIPLDLDLELSPRKILAAFREKHHELLILSSTLTGMQAGSLVSEIRRVSGSSFVLFIGDPLDQGAAQGIGVEWIKPPIVNWTRLLTKVRGAVPEALRNHLELRQSDIDLYQALVEYGCRYSAAAAGETSPATQVSLIPQHFFHIGDTEEGLAAEPSDERNDSPAPAAGETVFLEVPWAQQKRVLLIEVTLLGLMLAATTLLFLHASPDPYEKWVSLRGAAALITALSALGFFAGRALDRYLIPRLKKS